MRIALHQTSEIGVRTAQVLLAEPQLTVLGLVAQRPSDRHDTRLETAEDLTTYDVLVSDDAVEAEQQAVSALEAGISCVLWDGGDDIPDELGESFVARGRVLITGASLGNAIAPVLANHEVARDGEVLGTMWAWTERGRPLRRGEAIPFPQPVGDRWARERPHPGNGRTFVAPVDDEWAGAMAKVTSGSTDGLVSRIIGVADLGVHLEAIALSAAALCVADYPFGVVGVPDRGDSFLATCLRIGLDVATHELHG